MHAIQHCYDPSPAFSHALGRLLTHVPLQTGHWPDITRGERPVGQDDPVLPLKSVRCGEAKPPVVLYNFATIIKALLS